MRPFNIELWKAGEPVITRDGRKIEQLTYFENVTETEFKLMGVVDGQFQSWKLNGQYAKFEEHDDLDLLHPEPEMWVNVYQNHDLRCTGGIIDSKKEAEEIQASGNYPDYIGTYKLVKE